MNGVCLKDWLLGKLLILLKFQLQRNMGLFKMGTYTDTCEIEDELHGAGVFYNGLRGEDSHAHMDSYMTCINYQKLDEMWGKLKDKFNKETWIEIAKYWRTQAYLSPNCFQLYCYVFRKFGIEPDFSKE